MCTVKCGGIMLTYLVTIATDVNPTSICLTPTSTQKTVMYLCSSVIIELYLRLHPYVKVCVFGPIDLVHSDIIHNKIYVSL